MKEESNGGLVGVAGSHGVASAITQPGSTCGDEGYTGQPARVCLSHLQSADWLTQNRPAVCTKMECALRDAEKNCLLSWLKCGHCSGYELALRGTQ